MTKNIGYNRQKLRSVFMMKRKWIAVHVLMVFYSIYVMVTEIKWDWFLGMLAPFASVGLLLFTVAFISGGDKAYLCKWRIFPEILVEVLGSLGEFYKKGSPSLFKKRQGDGV